MVFTDALFVLVFINDIQCFMEEEKSPTSGNILGQSATWRARLIAAGDVSASPIVMLLK